jgi:hypothetical protein
VAGAAAPVDPANKEPRCVEPTPPASPSGHPSFTIVAIGDTGERNHTLYRNAMGVNREVAGKAKDTALVFLGDNFYKHGLSDSSPDQRKRRFASVYGLFEGSFTKLGHELGNHEWKRSKPPCPPRYWPGAAGGRVHAVAGNHDYYSESVSKESFRIAALVPLGFSTSGNEYEATRKEWNYYYGEPGEAFWPLEGSGKKGVQAIFIDSAILVRGETEPQYTGIWFYGFLLPPLALSRAGAEQADGQCWNSWINTTQDCLSYAFRDHVKATITRLLRARRHEDVWRVIFAHHPLHTVGAHAGARWRPDPAGNGGTVKLEDLCSRIHRPLDWAKNQFDPQDLCSEGWGKYRELVLQAIRDSGTSVDAFVAGHDHSLQRIPSEAVSHDDHGRRGCPGLQIVSGAGAKVTEVMASEPGGVLTAQNLKDKGKSLPGWVRLHFSPAELEVVFFSGGSEVEGGINGAGTGSLRASE